MRVLLDTNILIHREANRVVREDIGVLFHWMDKLKYEKCVHPASLAELTKHADKKIAATMSAKMRAYTLLKTKAPDSAEIRGIHQKYDSSTNDAIDTALLNEVFCRRVDLLITEDRKIHRKARDLGIADRVFTIDDLLEKFTSENPGLVDYKVLSVKREYLGRIDLNDPFFGSLKKDYIGFEGWFNRKADEMAYICKGPDGRLLAFLYLKEEGHTEPYSDIKPQFEAKKRLKIGTFKVAANGFKLGERFLTIIFDNALNWRVDEIYVTIFPKDPDQERLILLLRDWGFVKFGKKTTSSGVEEVYVRDFAPSANRDEPRLTFPYLSREARKFIVSIRPKYHTELFPDSILRTESPLDFVENKPNRNAIRKVFISRSSRRDLAPGDIIVFYRTRFRGPAWYTSVATTFGVVERVIREIGSFEEFKDICRKRSVFDDVGLRKFWDANPRRKPFVVKFLYVYSLPKRPILRSLREQQIISKAPRGFDLLTNSRFEKLCTISNADARLIVDQA
jgi:hypothetical protein